MNIEHLHYFIVIAENHSINKAAQKLFVSQQHLSRIVQSLETEMRCSLLVRTNTGIQLTPQGIDFLSYALEITDSYRRMHTHFFLEQLPTIENEKDIPDNVSLGIPYFFSLFLGPFLRNFRQQHPNVNLQCFENPDPLTVDYLRESENIHLVLIPPISKPDGYEAIQHYPIGYASVLVCANRNSTLSKKGLLRFQDLSGQQITNYMRSNTGFSHATNVLFRSSNLNQHFDSVLQNQTICMVPSYIQKYIYANYPDIVLLPIKDMPEYPVALIHSQQHQLTNADIKIMRFVTNFMHDQLNL